MPEEFSNEVLLQCFDEKEYLQKFLEQQIRVDGREFDQLRECSLSPAFLSQALGSSIVNLGGTKFTCGIECEVGKPSQDQPYSGDIVFDVHLWSISSVKYDQRGKCDDAYLLESMLDDVFSEAVLDRKQLCIEPCKYAFRLVIRLVCVVDDGNLFDAAVLSTLAALRNCKLPETQIVDNCVFRTNKESSPITLSRNPLSVTCALYGDSILADPDAREEKHQTGSVTCVLDEADSVLLVKQNADTGVSKAVIERAISLCTSKSVKLRRLLN